jgi:GT2 family glycosyltransferase
MQLSTPNVTVYVLQNGMGEADFVRVVKAYPQVVALAQAGNLGAAGGRNRLIAIALAADYDYLLFLDSDACLAADALDRLVHKYPRLERPGLVSCLVRATENPDRVHSSGVSFDRVSLRDIHHRDVPAQETIQRDAVITTAALISCEVLRNIPGLDERIFAYWEDVDWSLQIGVAGRNNYVVFDAVAFHSESRSRFHPAVIYYMTRNHLLVISKLGYPLYSLAVLRLIQQNITHLIRRALVGTPLVLNCFLAAFQAYVHVFIGRWGIAPKWMRRSNEQFLETRLHRFVFQNRLVAAIKLVWKQRQINI